MNGHDATANNTASLIKIPGYRIKKVLGRGGMATVYLAIQESLDREVALKILDPNQAQGKHFSERFLREARIVSQLMHPNIVTVFDVGVHQGYHYLSMEYIDGRDLKQACADLSRKELISIIKDVARALDFAAKKGYVHRDVKPENIMQHTADGRVLLMDFGIARSYQTTHGLTKAGSALGTPYYMSPEQNKGLSADHRSDIYSLGVVFFHMLSGYVPYDADSAVAIGIKHITATIPQLSDELQIFQPIINNCMAKEVDDRYQTAAELIEALDKITDADLKTIEARSAAFCEAGKNHRANTLISSEVNSEISFSASSDIHNPSSTKTPAERTSFVGFLLLLLILVTGALAYQQREKIRAYTETLNIPWLIQVIGKPQAVNAPTAETIKPSVVDSSPVATLEKIERGKQSLRSIERVQLAIDAGDVGLALKLMTEMQRQYPTISRQQRFIHTYKKLQTQQHAKQVLSTHMTQAKKYLAANTIISKEKPNALSELEAALMLDPSHSESLKMLHTINLRWLKKAEQRQASWQLRKELQTLDSLITRTTIQQPLILEQQKKLQQKISQIARIKNLLQQADNDFNNNLLISPENNNAYYRYQKVLAIDSRNQHAKAKLKAIKIQLGEQIAQAIAEDQLPQATLLFEQLQSVYSHSDWLLKIEAELEQAIEARQPKIDKIIFSATPLQSLDQPQATALQPGRTLYIGFHFKNMENSPTLLQAVLFDGAGRVQIAQKPVILSASEGQHFFQIDLPVEGFSEGSYILDVRLNDQPLLNQSFMVNATHQP